MDICGMSLGDVKVCTPLWLCVFNWEPKSWLLHVFLPFLPHQTTFRVSGGNRAQPWGGLGCVGSLAGWLTRSSPRKLLTGRELGLIFSFYVGEICWRRKASLEGFNTGVDLWYILISWSWKWFQKELAISADLSMPDLDPNTRHYPQFNGCILHQLKLVEALQLTSREHIWWLKTGLII